MALLSNRRMALAGKSITLAASLFAAGYSLKDLGLEDLIPHAWTPTHMLFDSTEDELVHAIETLHSVVVRLKVRELPRDEVSKILYEDMAAIRALIEQQRSFIH